jgi:Uma2 family endonuclease
VATTGERLTWDDLVVMPEDQPGGRQEIIDGKLIVTPIPTVLHQIAVMDATRQLVHLVTTENLGMVMPLPIGVRFTPDNVVVPDAVFVARNRAHVFGPEAIDAAPDLILEVLSPETRERDLTVKRALYARFGVQEYWIIDPDERKVDLLALIGDRFVSIPPGAEGAIHSRILPRLVLSPEIAFEGIEELWGASRP